MTIKEAKAELKKYGTTIYRGVRITESKRLVDNWEQYTGKYYVSPIGHTEPVNDEAVKITKAFEIAKPYFK